MARQTHEAKRLGIKDPLSTNCISRFCRRKAKVKAWAGKKHQPHRSQLPLFGPAYKTCPIQSAHFITGDLPILSSLRRCSSTTRQTSRQAQPTFHDSTCAFAFLPHNGSSVSSISSSRRQKLINHSVIDSDYSSCALLSCAPPSPPRRPAVVQGVDVTATSNCRCWPTR